MKDSEPKVHGKYWYKAKEWWNRSRHGSPGCYDAMISVWGCTYNFRAACYNAGLCTDYYKAKNY